MQLQVPAQLQAKFVAAANAYVLKSADLTAWAIVKLKYPTITETGAYKVRVALAIKEGENWINIETALTVAEKILSLGFLSEAEAQTAYDWVVENATETGNKDASLRLLPSAPDAYMAISLRENLKPTADGSKVLAKNSVAINKLMLFGMSLERQTLELGAFEGLDLPMPSKVQLKVVSRLETSPAADMIDEYISQREISVSAPVAPIAQAPAKKLTIPNF